MKKESRKICFVVKNSWKFSSTRLKEAVFVSGDYPHKCAKN